MKKRIMAMLMTAILIIASVPFAAFAEEAPAEMLSGEVSEALAAEAVETVGTAAETDAEMPAEAADVRKASGEETAEALLAAGTPDYLYFKNTGTESVTITIMSTGLGDGVDIYDVPEIQYSTDKSAWTDVTIGARRKDPVGIVIPEGGIVYLKGDYTSADCFSVSKYIRFDAAGTDAALKLGGDITTLLDGVGGIDDLGNLAFPRYNGKFAFYSLFRGMKALTDISDLKLPSTKLEERCCYQMFTGTGIREIPEGLLPATTLAPSCYQEMFSDCESLERISAVLPAAEVTDSCYESMFYGCSALKEIPAGLLPAADLSGAEEACYASMFCGCTALEKIPEGLLPATKLCEGCYAQMFYDCTALKTIPEGLLPATVLSDSCYQNMFSGCTALTSLPEDLLPATDLAELCYGGMFVGCRKLAAVPARLLPAEELAASCYNSMFYACESLTVAPDLPAEDLVKTCYANMFDECRNLESVRAAFEKWGSYGDSEEPDYCATDSFLPSFLADGVVLSFRCSRNLSENDNNIIRLKDRNQIELLKGIHTVTAQMNEYGTLKPEHYLYHEDDDTVSLLPDPEEGMLITGVIYKDYRGEHDDAILIDGKYRFTMPADDVTVWATGEKKPDPKPDPTPSDDNEPLFTGTWGNPVKNGAWKQDANGIWSYITTQVFRNTWGYIANPYAQEGQHPADWFYFDQYGHMLTGWQFVNGKWYYLNPAKDGTLGACFIGPGRTPDGWEIDASGAWTGR